MQRRTTRLVLALTVVALAGAAAGVRALLRYEPGADRGYDTRVASPVLTERRPRVAFDEGHRNVHSAHGRYWPFVRLIASDGCAVTARSGLLTAASLKDTDILVIVNPEGPGDERARSAFSQDQRRWPGALGLGRYRGRRGDGHPLHGGAC